MARHRIPTSDAEIWDNLLIVASTRCPACGASPGDPCLHVDNHRRLGSPAEAHQSRIRVAEARRAENGERW